MTKVLGFDTSASHCGAAIMVDGDVVSALYENMVKGQAERLFPMLEEVLGVANVGFADLDAIGVGVGPGNFTGIRISVSAARGLAVSLGVPAVGVDLFDALALGAPDVPLLLSLKASRDRFYLQTRIDGQISGISVAMIDELPRVAPDTVCIGAQSQEISARLGLSHLPAAYAPASAIARLASARWRDAPASPAPLYVREANAVPPSDPPPVILDDA